MRCKKHPVDLSSSVGVCASCLQERLLSLLAAQAQAQSQNRVQGQPQSQPQQQPPPPLEFPRSVSPYVSRRKSDDTETWNRSHHRRFHSTPQVGNTIGCFAPTKNKHRKFSILSYLFRSRSEKFDSNHDPSPVDSDPRTSVSPHRESTRTSLSSPYWSSILPGRRRAPTRMSSMDDGSHPKPPPISGRGMSPSQEPDSDPDCEDSSPSRSGYASTWRSTPTHDAGKRTRPRGLGRNMSSLAFCLSPLVRASPSQQWKQKGGPSKESVFFSGEVRGPPKPHISTAAGFCANRSRKLADFGRPNQNR